MMRDHWMATKEGAELLWMGEAEFLHEEAEWVARYGGSPLSYAAVIKSVLMSKQELPVRELCLEYLELHEVTHPDAEPYLRLGLMLALQRRPAAEKSSLVNVLVDRLGRSGYDDQLRTILHFIAGREQASGAFEPVSAVVPERRVKLMKPTEGRAGSMGSPPPTLERRRGA